MENIYEELLEKQKKYFEIGGTKNIKFRLSQLQKLKKLITTNEAQILEAIKLDLSKPDFENILTETQIVLWELDYFIKNLNLWIKPKVVKTPLFHFPAKSYIQPEPLGQTLIIAPWNYPFQLLFAPLVASVAAGNTTVLKPSEISANTSKIISNLIKQNFDEKYIAVVEGGVDETQKLLNCRWNKIFYTGSTKVGKIVMQAAAKNLTPVTLELGGKSPCIVDTDIKIKQTARKIAWGKFLNAGQTCIAPDYILVNKKIKNEFILQLINTIKIFYTENPIKSKDYARIINVNHFDRLVNYLKDGEIVAGGDYNKELKYISPTLIINPKLDSNLMTEEIFGPILPIVAYETIDEAISFINQREKPLALYIFSTKTKIQSKILNNTSSGGVCINDTISHITTSYLPFGGVGNSGMGKYHGKIGFEEFSHLKSVMHKTFLIDYKLRYPPYIKINSLLKKLFKFLN